jgi:signal transduction histidine kinase
MNFEAIAHDLKTPLTAVLGSARLIATEDLSPDARRLLAVIEAQVERMALLIDSYLVDPTGLDAITDESAGEILLEVTREIEPLVQRAGVIISVAIDDGVPRCRCARLALHRAILNVIKNAIDATPGSGTIACRVRGGTAHDVSIQIADSGIGMAENVLARAFEPGFTTKARHNGHGLGLAICKELLGRQGGSIAISSRPGHGTRVVMTLPAVTPASDSRGSH